MSNLFETKLIKASSPYPTYGLFNRHRRLNALVECRYGTFLVPSMSRSLVLGNDEQPVVFEVWFSGEISGDDDPFEGELLDAAAAAAPFVRCGEAYAKRTVLAVNERVLDYFHVALLDEANRMVVDGDFDLPGSTVEDERQRLYARCGSAYRIGLFNSHPSRDASVDLGGVEYTVARGGKLIIDRGDVFLGPTMLDIHVYFFVDEPFGITTTTGLRRECYKRYSISLVDSALPPILLSPPPPPPPPPQQQQQQKKFFSIVVQGSSIVLANLNRRLNAEVVFTLNGGSTVRKMKVKRKTKRIVRLANANDVGIVEVFFEKEPPPFLYHINAMPKIVGPLDTADDVGGPVLEYDPHYIFNMPRKRPFEREDRYMSRELHRPPPPPPCS